MKKIYIVFIVLFIIGCDSESDESETNDRIPNQIEISQVNTNKKDPQLAFLKRKYGNIDEKNKIEDNSFFNKSESSKVNSLEFDDDVRKLAYIAGKDKIFKTLVKDGSYNIAFYPYNPNKSRYLGSNRFLVNIYCTYIYDGYNRKKGFQLEMFYYGNNTWKTQLLKQKNID